MNTHHSNNKFTYYKAFSKIPEWDIVECLEETREQITIAVALSEEMAIKMVDLLNQYECLLLNVSSN
jgi:hypothetical protein